VRQFFDDEEGNIPRAFSVDDNRSLPHRLITLIADDEPAPLSLGSPLSRPEPSQARTSLVRFRGLRWNVSSGRVAGPLRLWWRRAIGPAALLWSQPYD
jgi:hypothetical protein